MAVALPILPLAAVAIVGAGKGRSSYSSCSESASGKVPFGMLKLRTMVPDADKMLASPAGQQRVRRADVQDPRRTRGSRRWADIAAASVIDVELPQFINVLRQEMSVVGLPVRCSRCRANNTPDL